MLTATHDIDANRIYRIISKAVGGTKVLASELNVSQSIIERQTLEQPSAENELANGVRTDLERVEQIMIAAANSGKSDLAFLPIKYLAETLNEILGENILREIKALEKEKENGSAWKKVSMYLKIIAIGL